VSRRDERQLAARLARVLDGEERPRDELAVLVGVLERATAPARFEVPADFVERELGRVRPRLGSERPRLQRRPRIALAFGAAAVAAAALLLFTFLRLPGVDVEGKALAALGGTRTVLKIRERIEPLVPGSFPVSVRTVWLDANRGVARWFQVSRGRRIEDVLVEQGRFKRYLPQQGLLIAASSCTAFASGCAELVDPVAFYRQALEGSGAVKAKREGSVYVLTLPVQSLPDATRIEQRVTIDAKTYLPKTIVWRERPPGQAPHAVSRIVIERIEHFRPGTISDPFHLHVPYGTTIEQRAVPGEALRRLGVQRLSLDEARAIRPPLLWLGPEHHFRPLGAIEKVRWNAGAAYRFRYGSITLWNYRAVVPPELLASRVAAPAKPIPIGRNVGHFYVTERGEAVAELDQHGWSVAIVAPPDTKEDVIAALLGLRPLR
jgi:hypothetical protein